VDYPTRNYLKLRMSEKIITGGTSFCVFYAAKHGTLYPSGHRVNNFQAAVEEMKKCRKSSPDAQYILLEKTVTQVTETQFSLAEVEEMK
jgi:hypothetical protein